MPTAAIILAAGASSRLGRPKQLLTLGGETLLERAVSLAHEAGLTPVIAVLSAPIAAALPGLGCTIILNPHPEQGMASSIRLGILAAQASAASGAVLLTCDQVALTPAHLRALADHPATPTASAYAGRQGIPAYFPAANFPDLLALSGDHGARNLLTTARSVANEDLALDIDTEADFLRAQQRFARDSR